MARIKKAQGGRKLTPKRTREVADSLENIGYLSLRAARTGDNKSDIGRKTSEYLIQSGMKDIRNSERYRSLADKAEKKKPAMKKGGKVMLKRADGSVSQRGRKK